MAFAYGSGTKADPYLLSTVDDISTLIVSYLNSGLYFALTNDIDASGTLISHSNANTNFNLDGRGFHLKLKIRTTYNGYGMLFQYLKAGSISNAEITFEDPGNTYYYVITGNPTGIKISNARINFNFTVSTGAECLFNGSNSLINGGSLYCASGSTNIYKYGSASAYTINTSSFADANPYNPDNYTGFDEQYWMFDGLSLPTPRQQPLDDLVVRQCIKGKACVGGVGKQRTISFYTPTNGYRYKKITSNVDGSYLAVLNDVIEPVIVMHYDDPGLPFVASKNYVIGDRIHPPVPNGYVYACTTAGSASSTAPAVWPTSGSLTSGSAIFTAMPIYAPASHLAVPSPANIITGEPA